MTVHYDNEGDYIEFFSGDISSCYFDNLGKGVFRIVDKRNGEVKGLAIFSFKRRTGDLADINISLPFKFNIIPQ